MRPTPSGARLAAFAAPAAVVGALSIPLNVYLPALYARDFGLDLAAVGAIFLAARLWDIVVDPAVGALSDRTRGRFGRRRPWIMAAAPVLLVFTPWLFTPGANAGYLQLAISLFGIYVAYSMLVIPHLSWAAEMAPQGPSGMRVQTFLAGGTAFGVLSAMGAPLLAPHLLPGAPAAHVVMAGLLMLGAPVAVALAVLSTAEPAAPPSKAQTRRDYAAVLRNPVLLGLLAADLAYAVAIGSIASLFLFFVEGVLGRSSSTWLLFVFYGAAIASVPTWLALSARVDKRTLAAVAAVLSAICAGSAPLLAAWPGGAPNSALVVYMLIFGAVAGNIVAVIRALAGEAAQAETLRTGRSDTGIYFALLSITGKLGLGVAAAASFAILDLFGVDPRAISGAQFVPFFLAYAGLPAGAFVIVAITMRIGPKVAPLAAPASG